MQRKPPRRRRRYAETNHATAAAVPASKDAPARASAKARRRRHRFSTSSMGRLSFSAPSTSFTLFSQKGCDAAVTSRKGARVRLSPCTNEARRLRLRSQQKQPRRKQALRRQRPRRAWRAAVGLAIGVGLLVGCGTAGVIKDAKPPERHPYASPHGRPRAYGGGVCAITSPHTHSYPPVPARAFTATDDGAVDERPRYPYWDTHPHHRRTCFRTEWHLHLDPPLPFLRYDPLKDTYTTAPVTTAIPLETFEGAHAQRECDEVRCVFEGPHGHAPCGVRAAAQRKAKEEGPP